MNISNLNELLNTQILNEGSTLSVCGFSLDPQRIKQGFAFFGDDEEAVKLAIKQGAFVVISQKELPIEDKEVYYLKAENLELCLLRFLRFLCEEKELCFLLCDFISFHFVKAFTLKSLKGNAFLDFENLLKAKKGELFCFNEKKYLLNLCVQYETLIPCSFTLIKQASLFYTSLIYGGLYFKNLNFPFIFAQIFVNYLAFLKKKNLKLNFEASKLDFFKIYFIDQNSQIKAFGSSSRAFILVFDLKDFEFFKENLQQIRGFKTSLKNSLLCDFSYATINDLKNFKDFNYCLVLLDNEEEFKKAFLSLQKEKTLF